MRTHVQYSKKVQQILQSPANVGVLPEDDPDVGTGLAGEMKCGDVVKIHVRIGSGGMIADSRYKTFGCGHAIAAGSRLTEMVIGRSVNSAMDVAPQQLIDDLEIPPEKHKVADLAVEALRKAIADATGRSDGHYVSRTTEEV
ncbi:MAG: iron-sulfur cluster assembly scaffold protein [Phycisphaerae bacterium]